MSLTFQQYILLLNPNPDMYPIPIPKSNKNFLNYAFLTSSHTQPFCLFVIQGFVSVSSSHSTCCFWVILPPKRKNSNFALPFSNIMSHYIFWDTFIFEVTICTLFFFLLKKTSLLLYWFCHTLTWIHHGSIRTLKIVLGSLIPLTFNYQVQLTLA